MKKRVLAGIFMMIFALASVMTVSAAGSASRTDDVYVSDADEQGYYKVVTDDTAFSKLKNDAAKKSVYDAIVGFNAGSVTQAKLFEGTDMASKLSGKTNITKVVDLVAVNGGTPVAGKHEVTLTVTTLTSNVSEVVIAHYGANGWEIITPSNVDVPNKKVTASFTDLSPIMIYGKVAAGGSIGTSPSTGVDSTTWMIWTAAALIVIGAGVVVSQMKSR